MIIFSCLMGVVIGWTLKTIHECLNFEVQKKFKNDLITEATAIVNNHLEWTK